MKTKYIGDSIHGGIIIDDELILELFKTKEFKRLGRINQLGIVHFLYPMAQHSRLEHSLGVYELTRKMLESLNPDIPTSTKRAVLAAGLLHDIGHGPGSHLFETVSTIKHESYSIAIIEDCNSEIYQVFEKYDPGARKEVVNILQHQHQLEWCNQIISSEVDMDRLDYLLRDSYSTGLSFGQIDWWWLIKSSLIINDKLVFNEKALSTIESMLLGRFHMNIAIYWNKKNVANQKLYSFWFNRMKYLYRNNKLKWDYHWLIPIFEERKMTSQEFHNIDDYIIVAAIKYSSTEEDEIIRKISNNFLNQITPQKILGEESVRKFVKEQNPRHKNQTWDVVDVSSDFWSYQRRSSSPALILTNEGQIIKAVNYSTVISNIQKIRKEKIGVKI